MPKIIVAIDGYSACGKSTTARMVAQALQYSYVDSGAMYRAVTLYFIRKLIDPTNPKHVALALSQIEIGFRHNPLSGNSDTILNNENIEDEIRTMAVSNKVSEVAALPEVRKAMVAQQQKMGKKKGIVMDGRDIGTTVFPNAELKVFMTATMEIRAYRRQQELLAKDQLVSLTEIEHNLSERDRIDTTRNDSPLRKADDAIVIDNTHLTIEEQVEIVLRWVGSKL